MVKKSFLQSIWNVIVGSTDEKSHHRISAAQAEVLQKQYLENQKKSLQKFFAMTSFWIFEVE